MKICDQKIYVAQAGKKNHNTEISIEGMWASLMRSWFVKCVVAISTLVISK